LLLGIRLAIFDSLGESIERWEPRWVEYCHAHGIECELVDCYRSDVISRLRGFDGLLWHIYYGRPIHRVVAQHVLRAAEYLGLAVFPNERTVWYYDDKVAEKYALEAVQAPLVPTYVFYHKEEALAWLKEATYPLVWKLRGGAGSCNVRLVRSYRNARRLCDRAFGRGFPGAAGYLADARTKFRKARNLVGLWGKLCRMPQRLREHRAEGRLAWREKGCILFQEFMPGNTFDTRIAVVGERAWGFTRNVRPNDFRASGSGAIVYDPQRVGLDCVGLGFELARALGAQSLAVDFVRTPEGEPKIVEMSYGYLAKAVYDTPGYWDRDLRWHEGHYWPQDAILQDLVAEVARNQQGERGQVPSAE